MNIFSNIKNIFSKKLLFSFLLSYLITAAIPFTSMIYSYTVAEQNLEKQINQTIDKNLDVCLKAIDDRISSFTSISKNIENVINMSDFDLNVTPQTYDSINLSNLLNTTSKGYADMTYCYFPQNDCFISESYNAYSDEFLERFYSFDKSLTKDEFKNTLSSFAYAKHLITTDASGEKYIDFLYSIPMYDISLNIEYCIGFRLSYKTIENHIKKYIDYGDKNIYFIDKKNTVLFEKINQSQSELRDYSEYSELSISSLNNEIQFSKPFSHINWLMITTVPKRCLSKSISHMRYVTTFVMLLSLLLSVFLAKIFSTSNYKPIKMLLSAISSNNTMDDYKKIENAISAIQKQNHTIHQLHVTKEHLEYEKFLTSLISGNTEKYQPIDKYMTKYDISFISDNFSVIVFCIKNPNSLFNDEGSTNEDTYKNIDTITFIIKNVFEEIISEKQKGYVFECNGLISAIVNIPDDHLQTWEEEISEALKKTNSFTEKNFNFSFTAGTSDLHVGISQFSAAFNEANEAINYSIYMKNTSHISHHDAIQSSFVSASDRINTNKCNISKLNETSTFMKNSNPESIVDLVKKYINENYTNSNLNVSFIGNHFDMSPYYLSSMLKKCEGVSILEYITKVRIEASIDLLNKGATISEASSATGFTNTHTYHRQFNKLKGCTPKQYLNNLSKN